MSAEAELQRKNERLKLLVNLTTAIMSSLDLRDTLRDGDLVETDFHIFSSEHGFNPRKQ